PRDWQRFVQLYTPLLFRWARQAGAQEADAADLVQEVLALLLGKLPSFDYDGSRSFRAWLRAVLLNQGRDGFRPRAAPPERPDRYALEEASAADEDRDADEDRQRLVARALELIRGDFQPHTWQAFWEFFTSGRDAATIAADLGLSVEVIYSAKCRVLRR